MNEENLKAYWKNKQDIKKTDAFTLENISHAKTKFAV